MRSYGMRREENEWVGYSAICARIKKPWWWSAELNDRHLSSHRKQSTFGTTDMPGNQCWSFRSWNEGVTGYVARLSGFSVWERVCWILITNMLLQPKLFYNSMFDKNIDNVHLFIAKLVEKTVLTPVSRAFQSSIVQVLNLLSCLYWSPCLKTSSYDCFDKCEPKVTDFILGNVVIGWDFGVQTTIY